MTLILFDVDGTLVHSGRRDSRCFAAVYEILYRRPFPGIDWHRYPHVTDLTILDTALMAHFGRESDPEEVAEFQRLYVSMLAEQRAQAPGEFHEVPGAAALIRHLLERPEEYPVCVATGGWRLPAELKLRHVGIPVEQIPVTGADGKKTRQEILNAALEDAARRWGRFSRAVYIGDAAWDVHTTRAMQMNFLGVRFEHDHHILEQLGARHILSNFLDWELFFDKVHAAEPPDNQNL